MMGVGARADPDVQGQLRVVGDRAEELLGELGVEAGDRRRRESASKATVAAGRRCRWRIRRAPRPSAPGRSRSGGCPARSASASSSAWPRQMPTSSVVWCAPVSRSPLASTSRPSLPWRASSSSMWSRNPTPVETCASPPSRSSRKLTSVSLVSRFDLCGRAIVLASPHTRVVLLRLRAPSHARGLRVERESLGAGQMSRRAAPAPGRPAGMARRRVRAGRRPGPSGTLEAAGAACGQHVVGACGVVAEGGRRRPPDEDAAGGRATRRQAHASSVISSRCSGAIALASCHRGAESGTATRASGASPAIACLAATRSTAARDRVEHPRLDGATATTSPRSRAPPGRRGRARSTRRSRVVAGDHHQLGRARDAVDADLADELALRLLHVAVARAGDHVHRLDRSGAEGERRDRLRAAHRVDLVAPQIAAAAAGSPVRDAAVGPAAGWRAPPAPPPATLAGMQHISTVEG